MNWSQQSPQLLLFSVIAVWCIGFVAMVAGKSLKTHTASITAIVTSALLLILMSAAFFLLVRDFGGTQHLWTRGWIGPRDLEGAITVGILEDPLGLAMIVLSSVLTLIFVSSRWLAPQGEVRHYAGAVLGLSGVSLAWLSSTPWLAFIGIGIITLAGFVGLGVDENREAAEKISRFGRERAWGLIFAILGAAVLAGQRGALGFQLGFAFPAQRLDSFFDLAGGALLLTGLYLHLQPFPFLGWLVSDSNFSGTRCFRFGNSLSTGASVRWSASDLWRMGSFFGAFIRYLGTFAKQSKDGAFPFRVLGFFNRLRRPLLGRCGLGDFDFNRRLAERV
jgi:formate hydrogenlyase subunit 3/multisubunit Na+/H+ antiporter MnhD subunit